MNKLELWFFKRIIKREVEQGMHKNRIIKMYSLITEAARAEFTEDNNATLNAFLEECHRTSCIKQTQGGQNAHNDERVQTDA